MIDFLLSALRDVEAAKPLFRKALIHPSHDIWNGATLRDRTGDLLITKHRPWVG